MYPKEEINAFGEQNNSSKLIKKNFWFLNMMNITKTRRDNLRNATLLEITTKMLRSIISKTVSHNARLVRALIDCLSSHHAT